MATYELVLARTETRTVKVQVKASSKEKANDKGYELMNEGNVDWDKGEPVWAEEDVNEITKVGST